MAVRAAIPAGDGRVFVTRQTAADALDRNPDLIRRRARPVMCQGTAKRHVLFYDWDEIERAFADTPKRKRLTSRCA